MVGVGGEGGCEAVGAEVESVCDVDRVAVVEEGWDEGGADVSGASDDEGGGGHGVVGW